MAINTEQCVRSHAVLSWTSCSKVSCGREYTPSIYYDLLVAEGAQQPTIYILC